MYAQMIREELARQGRIGMSPAHVEAWMRLEHSTLDGLGDFARAVDEAAQCVEASDAETNRRLAESYGLVPRTYRAEFNGKAVRVTIPED